jgi:hypothetical protein
MSDNIFSHQFKTMTIINNVKTFLAEKLIYKNNKLKVLLIIKDSDNYNRIDIIEISKNKFEYKENINDKITNKEISLDYLNNLIMNNKKLLFINKFFEYNKKNKSTNNIDKEIDDNKKPTKTTKKTTNKTTKKTK